MTEAKRPFANSGFYPYLSQFSQVPTAPGQPYTPSAGLKR